MLKVIKFIRAQWLGSVLLVLFLIYVISGNFRFKELIKEQKKIELKVSSLNKTKDVSLKKIDSLSKIDTVFVTRIVMIKQKQNEKIKVVDALPVSGIQQFFSERYSE